MCNEYESLCADVSHVILDEVHERQVEMDFLMAILRRRCRDFPHLKIVSTPRLRE